MALELTGKLIQVMDEQTGSGRNGTWVKQDFVVETQDQFPKKVCCTAWGDKTEELRRLHPGDEIKVYFNLESREYNGRWYTDVKAWKLETLSSSASGGSGDTAYQNAPEPFVEQGDDDLPF